MNEPTRDLEAYTLMQWECRWHGVQNGVGLQVGNSNFCTFCIEKLLLDKLYPMKEKKIE